MTAVMLGCTLYQRFRLVKLTVVSEPRGRRLRPNGSIRMVSAMTARYSEEQLADYESQRDGWLKRADSLRDLILAYPLRHDQAGEYARSGFARRICHLEHAMARMAEVYPPNLKHASRDRVRDAELIIQAFVMNVFGALDNLAWAWAIKRNLKGPKEKALYRNELCFVGPRSKTLVASLTPDLREAIAGAGEWFKHVGEYRHGIVHQIPIYTPRLLSNKDVEELDELNAELNLAVTSGDAVGIRRNLDRRHRLGAYGAVMALNGQHSTMLLHPQMVCDLSTVVSLGETIMSELNRLSHDR